MPALQELALFSDLSKSPYRWHFGVCSWVQSVQFSRSVVSDSLRPHGLQHPGPPCPSPAPRDDSNSCPSSRWCHPTVSSSVVPFSSRLVLVVFTSWDPLGCSPPGSSVRGIFQARMLEWVAVSLSRRSSRPRIESASPMPPALQAESYPLSHVGCWEFKNTSWC